MAQSNNQVMENPSNHPCYDSSIGWYTPGGCDGFAAYLHNPWGFPTDIEKQTITKIKTVFEQYGDLGSVLKKYIQSYFGDRQKNQKEGLVKQYNILMKHVIDNKLIGIILWGADINNINIEISKYTTSSNTEITLEVHSICQRLIKEYIKKENVDELCRKSIDQPNEVIMVNNGDC